MRLIAFIILFFASSAFAADTFLCSDDDNDGVIGILKAVDAADRDCDGHTTDDCDDTVFGRFDGQYTTSGCGAGEYKLCTSGTYGACTSAVLAEKANNYYFSSTGSGTTCSFASPCAISALTSGGSVTITAPAAVYYIGSGDITGTSIFLTSVAGTSNAVRNIFRRYPTATGKFNTTGGCTAPCSTIKFTGANWDVLDLEITGGDPTSSGGLRADANNITFKGNWIHDVVGANSNNIAGIYGGSGLSNVQAIDNIVTNSHDPAKTLLSSDRQNVWNIGLFVGQGHIVANNIVGYTHAVGTTPYEKQGGGIRIKHGQAAASVTTVSELKNNSVYYTEFAGCGTASAGTWIHGNLMQGVSKATNSTVDGGVFELTNVKVYNNTIKSGPHIIANINNVDGAFSLLSNSTTPSGGSAGGYTYTGNVIDDSAETVYAGGNLAHIFRIAPYGSNADYTTVITGGWVVFQNNCYYNSVIGAALTNGFGVYEDTGAGFGSSTNFSGWQGTYGQDSTGVVGNPTFDSSMRYTATCPADIGWEEEWPAPGPTPTPSSGAKRKGQWSWSTTKGQN